VEQDYSLVYFHHGLNSKNKPPLSWLWQAYRAFERKYKKNLKALYLVHPTNFIKLTFQLFKPVIRYILRFYRLVLYGVFRFPYHVYGLFFEYSAKFGRKVVYINCLYELKQHIKLDQLCIPEPVYE